MTITEDILLHAGGAQNNSLKTLLNRHEDEDDEEQIEVITHSPYYFDDLDTFLDSKRNSFSILSTNINSIHAKFAEIQAFVHKLRHNNFEFSAICLQ